MREEIEIAPRRYSRVQRIERRSRGSGINPRSRHLRTVLEFKTYRAARARLLSFDAWSSARYAASYGRCREDRLP